VCVEKIDGWHGPVPRWQRNANRITLLSDVTKSYGDSIDEQQTNDIDPRKMSPVEYLKQFKR